VSDIKKEALDLADFAYERLAKRLEGLTDEEYAWEPVPDCWTIRPNGDGTFTGDGGVVFTATPPVTTISWRLSHIVDCLTAERCAYLLGLEPEPGASVPVLQTESATEAVAALQRGFEVWRGYVSAVDEATLWEPCGPRAGFYAEDSRASFVLHIIDELIHHGAEIGVLRDLYRAQRDEREPFIAALLRGDAETVRAADPAVVAEALAEHPDLMREASELGRWHALGLIAELGFPVDGTGARTALHHAAGAGSLDAVRLLLDLGADVNKRDDIYHSTPLGWAEYMQRHEMTEFLRSLEGVPEHFTT
jgi:hypothetical protein